MPKNLELLLTAAINIYFFKPIIKLKMKNSFFTLLIVISFFGCETTVFVEPETEPQMVDSHVIYVNGKYSGTAQDGFTLKTLDNGNEIIEFHATQSTSDKQVLLDEDGYLLYFDSPSDSRPVYEFSMDLTHVNSYQELRDLSSSLQKNQFVLMFIVKEKTPEMDKYVIVH